MNWEKLNRKNKKRSQKQQEEWKEVKNTFRKATDGQKKLIRKHNMYASELVSHLSKQAAHNIISNYAEEHGWESK